MPKALDNRPMDVRRPARPSSAVDFNVPLDDGASPTTPGCAPPCRRSAGSSTTAPRSSWRATSVDRRARSNQAFRLAPVAARLSGLLGRPVESIR